MVILTIPKKLTRRDDLVVIPRREYEALIELRKIREFVPTAAQKKALAGARKEYKAGKYLTINEFRQRLGVKG